MNIDKFKKHILKNLNKNKESSWSITSICSALFGSNKNHNYKNNMIDRMCEFLNNEDNDEKIYQAVLAILRSKTGVAKAIRSFSSRIGLRHPLESGWIEKPFSSTVL